MAGNTRAKTIYNFRTADQISGALLASNVVPGDIRKDAAGKPVDGYGPLPQLLTDADTNAKAYLAVRGRWKKGKTLDHTIALVKPKRDKNGIVVPGQFQVKLANTDAQQGTANHADMDTATMLATVEAALLTHINSPRCGGKSTSRKGPVYISAVNMA